jgi:hypothetical protein
MRKENNFMSDDLKKDGWAVFQDDDKGYNAEKDKHFYNIIIRFEIKSDKKNNTILSFNKFPPHRDKYDRSWYRYVIKEGVDHAKKIVSNIIKHFDNVPIDCIDIDLCLKKSFSLRKTKKNLNLQRR